LINSSEKFGVFLNFPVYVKVARLYSKIYTWVVTLLKRESIIYLASKTHLFLSAESTGSISSRGSSSFSVAIRVLAFTETPPSLNEGPRSLFFCAGVRRKINHTLLKSKKDCTWVVCGVIFFERCPLGHDFAATIFERLPKFFKISQWLFLQLSVASYSLQSLQRS